MGRYTFKAGFFACVTALSLSACGDKGKGNAPEDSQTVTVRTETVRRVSVGETLTVSGNIEARKTVNMGFLVAGRIASICGEEGTMVGKGQLVATIEPTSYAIAKELADVQVAQAQDEYDRLRLLHERKSVSESDFKKCEFALQGALAQQRMRQKDLSDTRLHASISGMLLRKRAEVGEIVSSGMPILEVADISQVKICAYIPEGNLRDVRIGQRASVRIDAIGRTVEATVSEVGGVADPVTRAFTVRLTADNAGMRIRPGMIAEVTIPTSAEGGKRMMIPVTAVLNGTDGRAYVYVADMKNCRAYRRNVSVGMADGDRIEITSGLKGGETIVTGGGQRLVNGSKIRF